MQYDNRLLLGSLTLLLLFVCCFSYCYRKVRIEICSSQNEIFCLFKQFKKIIIRGLFALAFPLCLLLVLMAISKEKMIL